MKKEELKLLDVVATLKEFPEEKVASGQVGTIVEYLAPNVFLIEFANTIGETITIIPVKADDLLKLHHELEHA